MNQPSPPLETRPAGQAGEPVTVAIMAGGQSTRMGTDKAFVLHQGRPMIEHVIERVSTLGQELLLITNRPRTYAHLGLPMRSDIFAGHGPLAGIHAAVHYARHEHTLVVACDMPWLNPDLLAYMIQERTSADVVVPRWGKYPEPLHAVYARACVAAMREKLAAQQLKITGFFGRVQVRFLEREEIARYDPRGISFTNINTPDELEAWQG